MGGERRTYRSRFMNQPYEAVVSRDDLAEMLAVYQATEKVEQAISLLGGRVMGEQDGVLGCLRHLKLLIQSVSSPVTDWRAMMAECGPEITVSQVYEPERSFGTGEMVLLLESLEGIQAVKQVEMLLFGGDGAGYGGVEADLYRMYDLVYRFTPGFLREQTLAAEADNRWVDQVLDDDSRSGSQKAERLMKS